MKKSIIFLLPIIFLFENVFSQVYNPYYNAIKGKYYALFIACQQYDDPSLRLSNSIGEAKALKKVLEDYYVFDDVNLLENPTKRQVIRALEELAQKTNENDNVLLIYSGHGDTLVSNKYNKSEGYWQLKDAKTHKNKSRVSHTWLSNAKVRDLMVNIPSRHSLLFVDACYGGAVFDKNSSFPGLYIPSNNVILENYKRPSRKAITSGNLELVPDGGVFIESIVDVLTEQPKKKLVPASSIFNFVKNECIQKNKIIPQYRPLYNSGDKGGEFIFKRNNVDVGSVPMQTISKPVIATKKDITIKKELDTNFSYSYSDGKIVYTLETNKLSEGATVYAKLFECIDGEADNMCFSHINGKVKNMNNKSVITFDLSNYSFYQQYKNKKLYLKIKLKERNKDEQSLGKFFFNK